MSRFTARDGRAPRPAAVPVPIRCEAGAASGARGAAAFLRLLLRRQTIRQRILASGRAHAAVLALARLLPAPERRVVFALLHAPRIRLAAQWPQPAWVPGD